MLKYSLFHTWVLQEEETSNYKVGLSSYMLATLGRVDYIGLPKVGEYVEKGTSLVILETSKSAVEISSPISGKIIRINSILEVSTELFNKDPEGLGWLCALSSTKDDIVNANLLSFEEYRKL